MIFVGDIASPSSNTSELFRQSISSIAAFRNKILVGNLEGLIGREDLLQHSTPLVYNHPSILPVLKSSGFDYVALANNHVLDLPDSLVSTCKALEEHNIGYFGFHARGKLENWSHLQDKDGSHIIIYNACWEFLLYHQDYKKYVPNLNIIDFEGVFNDIDDLKKTYPEACLVVYVHWSFDLEVLPLPMYRLWSKRLIDSGVKLVIGAHSHCVQGGEVYKEGYIVYGLGNFFFPSYQYAGGKLAFPDMSKTQLAFEYNFNDSKPTFHWFNADSSGMFELVSSEEESDCQKMISLSPYIDMDDDQYLDYYKSHRRKSKLVPVFNDYKPKYSYKTKLLLLMLRAKVARFLATKGLIKWQN
jgi:poly-gamma-glutamate synthesis protein (capsule biosynthesis protein)